MTVVNEILVTGWLTSVIGVFVGGGLFTIGYAGNLTCRNSENIKKISEGLIEVSVPLCVCSASLLTVSTLAAMVRQRYQ